MKKKQIQNLKKKQCTCFYIYNVSKTEIHSFKTKKKNNFLIYFLFN